MALFKWDPFFEVQELLDDKQKLRLSWDLAVDVYEEDTNVVVKMNVAGIDPDKFDITVEDETLRVAGSREKKEEVEDKNYYRKEIRSGSFERIIPLPTTVQSEKTMASYDNGVLKIIMPKKAPSGSKQVKVKVK